MALRRAELRLLAALFCALSLSLMVTPGSPAQAPAAAVADVMAAAMADREALPPAEGSLWRFEGPRDLQAGFITGFGLAPHSGRINEVAVHPDDPRILYATGATGGVWKSTDGGEQWASRSAGWPTQGATAVAIDPNRPNRVYVGTGDYKRLDWIPPFSVGVMRSLDGGLTWEATGTAEMRHYAVSRLVVDPLDSDTILAAAGRGSRLPGGTIFRSTNGATTWSPASVPDGNWDDLELCPDGSYWASASRRKNLDGNDTGNLSGLVYRSIDRGLTWNKVTLVAGSFDLDTQAPPDVVHVACDPESATVFVAVYVGGGARLFRTSTAGSSWSEATAAPVGVSNGPWAHSALGVTADFVFLGGVDMFRAPLVGTGQLTFAQIPGPSLHGDYQCVVEDPSEEDAVYLCQDGGLYRHASASNATRSLAATLGVTQVFRMDVHRRHGGLIGIGTQDLGDSVSFFANGADAAALRLPPNWALVLGGDGRSSAFRNEANSRLYLAITNGAIARYDGAARTSLQTSDAADAQGPLLFSNDTLFYAARNFMRLASPDTQDATTAAWIPTDFRVGAPAPQVIQALALCPSDPNVIYAGSSTGDLFHSSDAGQTWTELVRDGVAANTPIWAIAPSPSNCRDVLLGVGYEGQTKIRKGLNVFDAGDRLMRKVDALDPGAWTGAHGGPQRLPRAPIFAIVRHPSAPNNTWFVAGDAGVFKTENGGAAWTNATGPLGLPNTHVRDLRLSGDRHTLYAGTFGRGVWSMDLSRPAANVFSVRGTVTFAGRPVEGAAVVIEGGGRIRKFLKNTLTSGASDTTAPIVVDESATITQARATVAAGTRASAVLITPDGAELPMVFSLASGGHSLTGPSAAALFGRPTRGLWRFRVTDARGLVSVTSASVDFSFSERVSNLTGPDGGYTIEFVNEGFHTVSVFDCDCAPASIEIDGHDTRVDFALQPDVGIAPSLPNAAEGGAPGAFVVTRAGSTSNPLIVSYTVSGTATAGQDYGLPSGSVTIPAGSTFAFIPVVAINDTRDEETETVVVQLRPGAGYTVTVPSQAIVSIADNDAPPTLSINNTTVLEGGNAVFTVSLSQQSGKTISVGFTTSPGTARAGLICFAPTDYLSRSGTRTFTPGVTSLTISVPACADVAADSGETFTVQLSTPQNATFATAGASAGTATILDGTTGTFELQPIEATVDVDAQSRYELTWTVPPPRNWHDLKTVDLRVRDARDYALWVRFFETTNTVALYDPATGRFGARTPLGVDGRVETPTAVLHLKESAVIGSGPTGPSVTLALAVSFKAAASGQNYIVEAAATADNGDHDRFVKAGILSVR
jgi:photosystem II stability/assembly factor-like uncharacterized protein